MGDIWIHKNVAFWGSTGGSNGKMKKKKRPEMGVLAQRRGFSPLAARPAKRLSIVCFAVRQSRR